MKVGEIYEIQESWFKPAKTDDEGNVVGWTNENTRRLMPEFKVGAKVEVLEIDDYGCTGATMVRVDGGAYIDIEHCPISSYVWNFFDEVEVSKGELILVGEAQ